MSHTVFAQIFLVGKYQQEHTRSDLTQLVHCLQSLGCREIRVPASYASQVPGVKTFDTLQEASSGDLVIALGGDGTLLSTARQLAGRDVPILGVNYGRLGFLADIPLQAIASSLPPILEGSYVQDRRSILEARLWRGGQQIVEGLALNEVFVHKGCGESMIELAVLFDDRQVYTERADGLILSTPTGSTAYALSAGGPILTPDLPAMILVPICPHTLSTRPMVVPDRLQVRLLLENARYPAALSLDSHHSYPMEAGDEVRVRRANCDALFIHPQQQDFFGILRQKLHWAEKPGAN
ncbi:MAG: NAD(+)/NADH kinase [Acidithiobacillus sp.]|nr:NAD(+)/NADH kinase [Acidithiobacillus sp.]